MRKFLSVCLVLGLVACQKDSVIETERFSLHQEGEKIKIDMAVDYPIKSEQAALAKIRRQVADFLLPDYDRDLTDADLILKQFAKAESARLRDDDDFERPLNFINGSVDLLAQNSKYVTFAYDSYVYTGGAHGMSFLQVKTINKITGEVINDKILNEKTDTVEFKQLLKQGVTAYFATVKGAVNQCDFQEKYLQDELFGEYDANNLPLPQLKPYLTENGVGFAYMPYEISCYANGRIAFVLPYKMIKPYLSATVLSFVDDYNKNATIQAIVNEKNMADYQKYLSKSEHKKCER